MGSEFIDRSLSWGLDSLMRDDDDAMLDSTNCESMLWEQSADFMDEEEPLFPDLHMDDEILSSMELIDDSNTILPLEKRFEETQKSLSECIKKSQLTRMSLTIATDELKDHLKNRETRNLVDSVQESARQLQACFVVPAEIILAYPPTAAQKA